MDVRAFIRKRNFVPLLLTKWNRALVEFYVLRVVYQHVLVLYLVNEEGLVLEKQSTIKTCEPKVYTQKKKKKVALNQLPASNQANKVSFIISIINNIFYYTPYSKERKLCSQVNNWVHLYSYFLSTKLTNYLHLCSLRGHLFSVKLIHMSKWFSHVEVIYMCKRITWETQSTASQFNLFTHVNFVNLTSLHMWI